MLIPRPEDILRGSPKAGSVDDIRLVQRFLTQRRDEIEAYRGGAQEALGWLAELSGRGIARLRERVQERLVEGSEALRTSVSSAHRAFGTYADEVERIHWAADFVVRDARQHLAELAVAARTILEICAQLQLPSPHRWDAPPRQVLPIPQTHALSAAGSESALESSRILWEKGVVAWEQHRDSLRRDIVQWEDLIGMRESAELALARSLGETQLGELVALGSGHPDSPARTIAFVLTAEHNRVDAVSGMLATTHPLLRGLLGAQDGNTHPSEPPSPARVALWWSGLSGSERESLILTVPTVIGNLAGLAAAVRDRANRTTIAFFREHPQQLTPEQRRLVAGIQRLLTVEARQQVPAPPIEVLGLELGGSASKAAISYGRLDTATHTSWHVAGMHSNASEALPVLDAVARNLYAEKLGVASGMTGNPAGGNPAVGNPSARNSNMVSPAVIAWLGYETPGFVEVLDTKAAERGAQRLAAEIDGLRSSRELSQRSSITTVVAHSYGTTTATLALARVSAPVDGLVMLGSAGLDLEQVPTIDALRVNEFAPGQKAVFTTTAARDMLAPLGAGLAGRGLPNDTARAPRGGQLSAPVYGGTIEIPSVGENGRKLTHTDGHTVIGAYRTKIVDRPGRVSSSSSPALS